MNCEMNIINYSPRGLASLSTHHRGPFPHLLPIRPERDAVIHLLKFVHPALVSHGTMQFNFTFTDTKPLMAAATALIQSTNDHY